MLVYTTYRLDSLTTRKAPSWE